MSIETSDQEKSVMLAKLCGWVIWNYGDTNKVSRIIDSSGNTIFDEHSERSPVLNLYDPANMALAWRVLNWALTEASFSSRVSHASYDIDPDLDYCFTLCGLMRVPIAAAQRAWLDKILELAIEAGMVME